MSAKACNKCGGLIVFGHEKITGKIIPLSVGNNVYRVIKENIVELDPKALVRHVCLHKDDVPPSPSPVKDFNEPKEPEELTFPSDVEKSQE